MARIVLGSYMARYPLGGMMSWALQYLVGLHRLGHDVYFVEKAGYPNACYDLSRDVMTDDCGYGIRILDDLLTRFDLSGKWCFVDYAGTYYGLSKTHVEEVLASADVFVDMGTHGSWLGEAAGAGVRVMIDGEPGFSQMKRIKKQMAGEPVPEYDHYYTTGWNVGTAASSAPAAGVQWRHIFHPVVIELFETSSDPPDGAALTTVMNWRSYEPVEFNGQVYGHKDVEFDRFVELPRLSRGNFEVAVSGRDIPEEALSAACWRIRDAHRVTESFDSFRSYVHGSIAEFSVCKNGYVATNCGWFSDRSAAYLASGRPVIQQETGFSSHLPCGLGVFAVSTVEQAAAAADEILGDTRRHSKWARQVAAEYLSSVKVLTRFLEEL